MSVRTLGAALGAWRMPCTAASMATSTAQRRNHQRSGMAARAAKHGNGVAQQQQ